MPPGLFARALIRCAVPAFLALLACAALPAHGQSCDDPQPILQALRTVSVGPNRETALQTLPDHLPLALRDERHRIRYELDVSRCAGSTARSIWIFRAGAPYRINDERGVPLSPLVTGTPLKIVDALGLARDGQHNGRIPALYALPDDARTVTVELLTLPYIPSGLIEARQGPVHDLLPVQESAHRDVIAYADTVSGVVLVFGLLAVLLWRLRRDDQSLLWLAVACAMWGVRGLAYFNPRVYAAPLAFELFNPVNALVSLAALTASVLVRTEAMTPRAAWSLGGGVLAGTGAIVIAAISGTGAGPARFLCFALVIWILMWTFTHAIRTSARASSRTLAVLLAVLLATTAHDLMVVAGIRPPDSPSVVFWGFAILLVGVCLMSAQYVAAQLTRAENANEELIMSIVEKSDELERTYVQLSEIDREKARAAERERMVRDLHDGLSAQLVTTLRAVERGALGPEAIAGSLQESLDELRLLMDSGDLGDYLPAALAVWRNRWEPRMQAAGIALEWHIDDSVDRVALAGDATLQVMRILQEAAANVVKHSRARKMKLSARVRDAEGVHSLELEVTDNGVGFIAPTADNASGRGLRNMMHRARQAGASVQFGHATGGGTRVLLSLPVTLSRPEEAA